MPRSLDVGQGEGEAGPEPLVVQPVSTDPAQPQHRERGENRGSHPDTLPRPMNIGYVTIAHNFDPCRSVCLKCGLTAMEALEAGVVGPCSGGPFLIRHITNLAKVLAS